MSEEEIFDIRYGRDFCAADKLLSEVLGMRATLVVAAERSLERAIKSLIKELEKAETDAIASDPIARLKDEKERIRIKYSLSSFNQDEIKNIPSRLKAIVDKLKPMGWQLVVKELEHAVEVTEAIIQVEAAASLMEERVDIVGRRTCEDRKKKEILEKANGDVQTVKKLADPIIKAGRKRFKAKVNEDCAEFVQLQDHCGNSAASRPHRELDSENEMPENSELARSVISPTPFIVGITILGIGAEIAAIAALNRPENAIKVLSEMLSVLIHPTFLVGVAFVLAVGIISAAAHAVNQDCKNNTSKNLR